MTCIFMMSGMNSDIHNVSDHKSQLTKQSKKKDMALKSETKIRTK